jgi:cyanophycinase
MPIILLEGGAEFGGRMSEPDLRAIELAGGPDAPIVILPTAAAPDHNHQRAGNNGLRWFSSLGASRVDVVPVIDRPSAEDPALAARLRSARLIYMLGGFPGYLAETLAGSLAWRSALEAAGEGAILAGSSAGAMVLCEHLYDPEAGQVVRGLGILRDACVLPHHNSFGSRWAPQLREQLPSALLIGIDEGTGMLGDPQAGWAVYGAGAVTLYGASSIAVHPSGRRFGLPVPPGS